MEKLIKLTVKETEVLRAVLESEYQSCDSDSEAVIGVSMYQWDVLENSNGVGSKGFPGVISSLNKKGLVNSDSTGPKNEHTITITELGFNTYWGYHKQKSVD